MKKVFQRLTKFKLPPPDSSLSVEQMGTKIAKITLTDPEIVKRALHEEKEAKRVLGRVVRLRRWQIGSALIAGLAAFNAAAETTNLKGDLGSYMDAITEASVQEGSEEWTEKEKDEFIDRRYKELKIEKEVKPINGMKVLISVSLAGAFGFFANHMGSRKHYQRQDIRDLAQMRQNERMITSMNQLSKSLSTNEDTEEKTLRPVAE